MYDVRRCYWIYESRGVPQKLKLSGKRTGPEETFYFQNCNNIRYDR